MDLRDNNNEELFADAIKQIQLGIKRTASYPEGHPVSRRVINSSYEALRSCLNRNTGLTISTFGKKLLVNDIPMDRGNTFCSGFLSSLEQRSIDNIHFYDGLSMKEFMVFLSAMIKSPNTLKESGGVASILKKHGVSAIKLNHMKYGLLSNRSGERGKTDNVVCENNGTQKEQEQNKPKDVFGKDDTISIKEDIVNLLSKGKIDEIQPIIKDLTKKLDDSSWKIRKKVAENFDEITSVLDDFDKLKENFQLISDEMIKRVKKESHADTYLMVSENLRRICTSQNITDNYFIDETIGNRLFQANELSSDKLQKVLIARDRNHKSLQYNLAALNCVDESALTRQLSQQYKGCQIVNLSRIHNIPEKIITTIPVKFIKRYRVLPFKSDFGSLSIATMNPNELKDSDAPVVRLVNLILREAIAQKVSDIHIEPFENEMRVRFRTDGTLTTSLSPSIRYAKVIPSRIKIMAGLDISEKRLPQDGRFKILMNSNYVDFRVSTFPGIFGEKVVLRLLDNSNIVLDLNNLGFNDRDLTSILTAIYKSKGMI